MYSYDDRIRAVELYIKLGKRTGTTIRQLGYLSWSSGSKCREIVVVAIANSGLRLHLRAFDRGHRRFDDSVLTRTSNVWEIEVEERELLGAGKQWYIVVSMELLPDPDIKYRKAVQAGYVMHGGVLRLKALAAYVLFRWNIEASPNHRLDPLIHHLWLRNTPTLFGVARVALAPCVSAAVKEKVVA